MSEFGFIVGYAVRVLLLLLVLAGAAAAVRFGWTYPERRRTRRATKQRQFPPRT